MMWRDGGAKVTFATALRQGGRPAAGYDTKPSSGRKGTNLAGVSGIEYTIE